MQKKIRLGISSCLLGNKVRHDGGHKHSKYLTETLSEFFDFVPICPEMAIGLGTPRPAMHLEGQLSNHRLVVIRGQKQDYTDKMTAFSEKAAEKLTDISGYILKSKSPTCGMERIRIYKENQNPLNETTSGLFARSLMKRQPLMPIEEEGRLHDLVLRENFFERLYVFQRWQNLVASGPTMAKLVNFHTRHKFILMSRGTVPLYTLGRIVANHDKQPTEAVAEKYIQGVMLTLKNKAPRTQQTNVLLHIFGYLKNVIDAKTKANALGVIETYRKGYTPLVVPLTLIKHLFQLSPHPYIEQQYYLDPYPEELMLRNI